MRLKKHLISSKLCLMSMIWDIIAIDTLENDHQSL